MSFYLGEEEVNQKMKEMFANKNRLFTGLLVTLMMTVLFALPVMAKDYTVDPGDSGDWVEKTSNALPELLKAGDSITLTRKTIDGLRAKIWCSYYDVDHTKLDDPNRKGDEDNSDSCVVSEINGITEWRVDHVEGMEFNGPEYYEDERWSGLMICLIPLQKPTIEWNNECKKGTVGEEYDTAYWVFKDLDELKGYRSTACQITDRTGSLPKGVDVRTGSDPRNGGRMGINFRGTPKKAGTYKPVIWGKVTYSNDDGDEKVVSFRWKFTIKIEEPKDDDDDDDDDSHEEESSSSSNDNSSSQSTWTAPASTTSTQSETPAQQATQQLAAAQTAISSVPALIASNSAAYASTGMPLDMSKVNTLDASTTALLSANNKIPYNVTISFNGAPFTVKIPAGFNYSKFVKADGSMNIHEVLWAVLSGQKR